MRPTSPLGHTLQDVVLKDFAVVGGDPDRGVHRVRIPQGWLLQLWFEPFDACSASIASSRRRSQQTPATEPEEGGGRIVESYGAA